MAFSLSLTFCISKMAILRIQENSALAVLGNTSQVGLIPVCVVL